MKSGAKDHGDFWTDPASVNNQAAVIACTYDKVTRD